MKNKRMWLKILLLGFLLFIITLIVMIFTGNPNLFPTVVIIGSFLVPVSYVTFFYSRRKICNVNISITALCFLTGGLIGTLFAAIIEPLIIRKLTFGTSFLVGFIEESAKILAVFLIARRKPHNSEIDGVILGAAAGMGFAAFESAGYAFTSFLQSGGSITYVVLITLVRGILSPVGHGTWTAILAGVLFREGRLRKFRFDLSVIITFLTVVALHGLWDGLPTFISNFSSSYYIELASQLLVGIIGMIILVRLWHEARKRSENEVCEEPTW
jgi:protease PrsW